MPAWFTAIMLESEEVIWQPKTHASLSESGPDDQKLIIEFEGDLDKMPWVIDLSCQEAKIDINKLIGSNPALFDKAWLRDRGFQEASLSVMGNHHVIEINLSKS